MKRSILPLILVLIITPFFSSYHETPLRFGLLQGLLVALISISAAGGYQALKTRLRNPIFALFWSLLLGMSILAPWLIQKVA